jgi:hypothetical protein
VLARCVLPHVYCLCVLPLCTAQYLDTGITNNLKVGLNGIELVSIMGAACNLNQYHSLRSLMLKPATLATTNGHNQPHS